MTKKAVLAMVAALMCIAMVIYMMVGGSSSEPAADNSGSLDPGMPVGEAGGAAEVRLSPAIAPAPQASGEASLRRPELLGSMLAEMRTAGGERLLQLFNRGLSADATPEDKYVALQIVGACTGYVNPKVISRANNGRFQLQPPKNPLVRATFENAIDQLEHRCAPLAVVGRDAWRAAMRTLGADIRKEPLFSSPDFISEEGEPIEGAQREEALALMREALETYGIAALEWLDGSLLELMTVNGRSAARLGLKQSDIADPSPPLGVAAILARCHNNPACGWNGLEVLGLCVGSGIYCADTLDAAMLAHLPEAAARQRARQLADELVNAINARNWERLGLVP